MQRYLALFASLSLAAAVYPNEAYPNGCWYATPKRVNTNCAARTAIEARP